MGMKRYEIIFTKATASTVVQIWEEGEEPRLLDISFGLQLRNHSPSGFSFGYGGSGPSQLALSILLDVLTSEQRALDLYQAFKWSHVAKWSGDKIELAEEEVIWWAWMCETGGGPARACEMGGPHTLPFSAEFRPQYVSLLPVDIGRDTRHTKDIVVLNRCERLTVRCLNTEGEVIDVCGTTPEVVLMLSDYGYIAECQPPPLPVKKA